MDAALYEIRLAAWMASLASILPCRLLLGRYRSARRRDRLAGASRSSTGPEAAPPEWDSASPRIAPPHAAAAADAARLFRIIANPAATMIPASPSTIERR
ncbi:hypothetical protein [Methylobacterium sp. ARG-1]|uniref:hypothetical protein n=1 Tax=Methylobacterium sp. ARG-1 TaxID=1692501 RepID=UPI0006824D70|nr:hypothetical protein [Methylobacterium sp. ARG-1]KNY19527.1 hypothetical protein AKJ13_27270 [Methylobacterium sp. ARG-1]